MFEPLLTDGVLPRMPAAPDLKPKILVVDDARYIRDLLKMHLTNAGYDVETAEDAILAGKRVLQDAPGLLITDIEMPYMDGIQFVAAMRDDPAIPDIPIVFITAYDTTAAEAKNLRAAACLRKPVNIERLLEVISLYLPATRQSASRL